MATDLDVIKQLEVEHYACSDLACRLWERYEAERERASRLLDDSNALLELLELALGWIREQNPNSATLEIIEGKLAKIVYMPEAEKRKAKVRQ